MRRLRGAALTRAPDGVRVGVLKFELARERHVRSV
jgi:hypothetical protein